MRQEVARVRHIRRDMVFGAGIKILLCTRYRAANPLVLLAQLPPGCVVIVRRNLAGKHLPAPAVHHQSKGQKGDLVQGYLHEVGDFQLLRGSGQVVHQAYCYQVVRGYR